MVHGVFKIEVDREVPAAGDLRAVALDHDDVGAIGSIGFKRFPTEGRGVLWLFDQIDNPGRPLPGVDTKDGDARGAVAGEVPGGQAVEATDFDDDAPRGNTLGKGDHAVQFGVAHLAGNAAIEGREHQGEILFFGRYFGAFTPIEQRRAMITGMPGRRKDLQWFFKRVSKNVMHPVATALVSPADTAAFARQVGLILADLVAVIARRFLRDPRLLPLIVPLWRWLTHIARRLERVAVRRPLAVRVPAVRATRAARAERPAMAQLPRGRGWLVQQLGYEAAGYGSQLAHLLGQPEAQAILAQLPGVARILRPVCRVLGLADVAGVTDVAPPPRRAREAREARAAAADAGPPDGVRPLGQRFSTRG